MGISMYKRVQTCKIMYPAGFETAHNQIDRHGAALKTNHQGELNAYNDIDYIAQGLGVFKMTEAQQKSLPENCYFL